MLHCCQGPWCRSGFCVDKCSPAQCLQLSLADRCCLSRQRGLREKLILGEKVDEDAGDGYTRGAKARGAIQAFLRRS